jgi:hypothetical protein
LKVDPLTGKVYTIGRKLGVGLVTREHIDIDPVTNLITDPVQRAAVQGAVFMLAPSGDTSGAKDTAAIQAALTAGGYVSTIPNATYYINNTLIYGDDTEFHLSVGSEVRAVPGTNKTLMMSKAHYNRVNNPVSVTLTQVTPIVVSVYWPAHGLSVNEGVWIDGGTLAPSTYKGVFRVLSVTDSDNFVVHLQVGAESVPSGTAYAVKATRNFHISGQGRFNYDYTNNTGAPSTYQAHVVNLVGLLDCTASQAEAKNGNKYGWSLCATENFKVTRLRSTNRSDGIKIYGPCSNLTLDGFSGTAADDMISIQTKEGAAYTGYQPAFGDVFNVTVKNVVGNNLIGGSSLVLYPSDNELFDKIELDNICGDATASVGIRIDTEYTYGYMGQISIKNSGALNNSLIQTGKCNIRQLAISHPRLNPVTLSGSTAAILVTGSTSTIEMLLTDFGRAKYPTTGNTSLFYLQGTHGKIVHRGFLGDATTTNPQKWYLFTGGAWTLGELEIASCDASTGVKYLVQFNSAPASGSPIVTLRGNRLKSSGAIDIPISGMTLTVKLAGNDFNGLNLGVVRIENTNTVAIKSDGTNTFVSSTCIASLAGSPVITAYGSDLPLDVGGITGLSKTVSGQSCFNTGSGRGTLAQNRLVTCNGTNWVQVDAPSNVY